MLGAFRRLLGIRAYTPAGHPRARARLPTWYGARGNGCNPGVDAEQARVIADIAREQRIIVQMLSDIDWRRNRRYDGCQKPC